MYVLERYSDAKARGAKIYGEIAGYAMNSDATDFVLPNPERQAQCVEKALRSAGIGPEAMGEVKKLIAVMNAELNTGFEIDEGLVGGSAYDAHGQAISVGDMA